MLTPSLLRAFAAGLCTLAAALGGPAAWAEQGPEKPPSKIHSPAGPVMTRPGQAAAPGPAMHAEEHGALPPRAEAGPHMAEHREIEHREMEHHELARERYAFHEHDVHRFAPLELERWRGGRWNNTCFGGRCGWWWFAGGQWYFYAQPVYPYPMVVSTIGFVEPVAVVPQPVPVQIVPQPLPPPPAPAPVQPLQPPPKFLYYCDNPPGFYPTVQNCNTDFKQVAAPQ